MMRLIFPHIGGQIYRASNGLGKGLWPPSSLGGRHGPAVMRGFSDVFWISKSMQSPRPSLHTAVSRRLSPFLMSSRMHMWPREYRVAYRAVGPSMLVILDEFMAVGAQDGNQILFALPFRGLDGPGLVAPTSPESRIDLPKIYSPARMVAPFGGGCR